MCASSNRRPAGGPRGFTLLEVLIAFAILAIALGAILQSFSQGLRTMSQAERYVQATLLAESKLAEVGASIPLEEGEYSGAGGEDTAWRVDIRPYEDDAARIGDLEVIRLYRVEVEVSWEGGVPARIVTLRGSGAAP